MGGRIKLTGKNKKRFQNSPQTRLFLRTSHETTCRLFIGEKIGRKVRAGFP